MTTQAQIESNRINARRSTGPRTAEGKARCRHNALKHGLLSEQALLETEDAAAHREYCAALREDLRPVGPWEEMLAERVVAQGWRLRRAVWMETCVLDQALTEAQERDAWWRKWEWDDLRRQAREAGRDESGVPDPFPRPWPKAVDSVFAGEALLTVMQGPNSLDVLRRYERAIERGMHEAMRALKAVQRERAEGAGSAERAAEGDLWCHGPTSAEDRAATVGTTVWYGPAPSAEGPAGKDRAGTEGNTVWYGPEPSPEGPVGEDPVAAEEAAHEENCQTDPDPSAEADPRCHGPTSAEDRAAGDVAPHGENYQTDPVGREPVRAAGGTVECGGNGDCPVAAGAISTNGL